MEQKYKIISLQEEDEKNQNDFNIESFHPSPTAEEKTLTKPDFSPILSEETQFRFKTNGSYKKRKFLMPETPIKLIKKNYSTSIKIEGKDLFNIKKDKSFCRKLNLAQKSIKSMTREFKRKTELLKNLNTPEMLVPIKSKTDDSLKKVRKLPTRREMTIKNLNIENNGARVNTTSANENVLTTTSGSVENKNKENTKNIVRRESKKKK